MPETCETVVIKTDNGPVVINKSDFDEKIHKLNSGAAGDSSEPKKRGRPAKQEQDSE